MAVIMGKLKPGCFEEKFATCNEKKYLPQLLHGLRKPLHREPESHRT
jgi:hypothetical protein